MLASYLAANASQGAFIVTSSSLVFDDKAKTVTIDVKAQTPATFMSIAGYEALDVGADTKIERSTPGPLDVALVLDTTTSMAAPPSGGTQPKITSMIAAASALVTQIMADGNPEIRVGVVPFSGHVNVGFSNSPPAWITPRSRNGTIHAQKPRASGGEEGVGVGEVEGDEVPVDRAGVEVDAHPALRPHVRRSEVAVGFGGQQRLLLRRVDAIEVWELDRRAGDAHVHFLGAGVAQHAFAVGLPVLGQDLRQAPAERLEEPRAEDVAIAFLPQPGFGFALLQTLWSVLCYPLVVAASRFAFDLRKPATGEVDAYGRRL